MTNYQKTLEIAKVIIAYLSTFGVLIVPLPLLWAAVYRLRHTAYYDASIIFAGCMTMPLLWLSAYLSSRLGKWFLENWATHYINLVNSQK